ncbi:MAG: NADH-dependent [FeFe] hydrogenase, group A6 [Candidatus Omnitrophota bacterium]
MNTGKFINIDGREVAFTDEKNLLEVIRKANIDIPTFCYVSELSVYGACRMCTVEVEGKGLTTSCSLPPEPGMRVRTNTDSVRQIRKIALELILANHESECPTCTKNTSCKLQDLSKRMGITKVRFRSVKKTAPVDHSAVIVRNPNKCILCGDCVRMCSQVQGIGAIDFAYRGHEVVVQPAYGKSLEEVQCVYCGQCVRVCPTGALTPRSEVKEVWKSLDDKNKTVIVQIAPAVRVALGEAFGLAAGELTTGQIVAALKMMGFKKVFDTCFAADLTILEEGHEFIHRLTHAGTLPMFTSCCPGWVKYVEQHHPDMLGNLSSCRSPQQMFGAVAKNVMASEWGIKKEDMTVVSIMPCTAKKFEAKRPEFMEHGMADVDHVITTQELAQMINEYGIQFRHLQPEALDMPMGFKTGAGVIFGNTGGVTEAVLRFVYEKVEGKPLDNCDFHQVRGESGMRSAEVVLGGKTFKLAVVHSLANARSLLEKIRKGECMYHFIEVMSCPGGCVNGAGQPINFELDYKKKRTQGLYEADKMLQLHKSQDNPYIKELYVRKLDFPGSDRAHHLLHTRYNARRRMKGRSMVIVNGGHENKLEIRVCVGTSCYLRGAQDLLHHLAKYISDKGWQERVLVKATFCFEKCNKGPTVKIGEAVIVHCDFAKATAAIDKAVEALTLKV